MKIKNWILATILLVCLIGVVCFAFFSDLSDGVDGFGHTQDGHTIIISEICSKNETIIADNEGKYRDYIELYNPGEPVNLAGFTFTDGRATSAPLGDIILGTEEYRIFFLSKETTGFSIGSSGGNCVQLLDPSGHIVVQASTTLCLDDQVMLYRTGVYEVSGDASPGFPNTAEGIQAFRKGQQDPNPALVISEVLINNVSSYPDENGLFPDVVELHNISDAPVALDQYFLSDNTENRFRFRLPAITLAAGECAVILCDSGNTVTDSGAIHANFSISHNETLILTNTSGAYTTVTAQALGDDFSLSLTESGEYSSGIVSLGFANTEEGIYLFRQSMVDALSPLVISEVLDSSADAPYNGAVQDVVEILNRSESKVSTEGWYLSDGSDPYAYPLPKQTLAAGERMVIVCSTVTTGFSLSEGESVMLFGPSYRYAPAVACTTGGLGMSISLLEGSSDIAYNFSEITLGYPNTKEHHASYRKDQLPKDLIISELMSANRSYLKGSYATTCDWIEVYNNSDHELHLADYYLSDDAGKLSKYQMPDITLQPGEYRVIFLSADPLNLLKGYSVLPFSLSSDGDQLYLSHENVILDYVHIPALPTDFSYGRPADGTTYSLLGSVTPGKANASAVEMSAVPTVETPQGTYDDVENVQVVLSGPGNIYYTTNCKKPTTEDNLYTGPITLTKTTVLRVMCQEPGKLPSEVVDLTYIVNEYNALPSVSVVAEPADLWSNERGIYVDGPNIGDEPPYYGANYWYDWERETTLSLFELDGNGFSIKCGVKIFGGFTRSVKKKSLAFFFRDNYGASELTYPVFGEESLDSYESIILRTSGQDAFMGRMRDVVLTSLMGEYTDVPVQNYKPVVVYLNGEYWGLHYIREKLNENYVAGHYNVPADSVTIVEFTGWNNRDYRQLVTFVLKNNMAIQENYDYVCSQMDVDNYIDLYIAQIWNANQDNGNVKFFRIDDGKWTWFFYDTDFALRDVDWDNVNKNLTTVGLDQSDIICRTFAARMMAHPEFRDKFLRRMAWQMNTIWTEENVLNRISEIEAMILPVMERECERWDVYYGDWRYHVNQMQDFARNRNKYMLIYIKNFFNLTNAEMRAYGFNV